MFPLVSAVANPRRAFATIENINVVGLAVAFCLIQFVVALTLFGSMHAAAVKVVSTNPMLSAAQIPVIVGISLLFATVLNIFLLAVVSLIMLAVVAIAGQAVKYRDIFCMLMLAYVPAVIVQCVRGFSVMFGVPIEATKKWFTLGQFFPVPEDGSFRALLNIYDIGDVWVFALVIFGFCKVSKMKTIPAIISSVVIWGTLLLLLGRMQSAGGAA